MLNRFGQETKWTSSGAADDLVLPYPPVYPNYSAWPRNSTIGRKICNMLQSESLAFTIHVVSLLWNSLIFPLFKSLYTFFPDNNQ